MTQEEKQLLLIDICARLPYEVKCRIDYDNDLEYDDLDAEDREDTSLYGDYRPASGKDKNQE